MSTYIYLYIYTYIWVHTLYLRYLKSCIPIAGIISAYRRETCTRCRLQRFCTRRKAIVQSWRPRSLPRALCTKSQSQLNGVHPSWRGEGGGWKTREPSSLEFIAEMPHSFGSALRVSYDCRPVRLIEFIARDSQPLDSPRGVIEYRTRFIIRTTGVVRRQDESLERGDKCQSQKNWEKKDRRENIIDFF